MMDWYGGGMNGVGGFMWVVMGLFWMGLIVLIIYLVVKLLPGSGGVERAATASGAIAGESPEQMLDRMFAAGDIDEDTYRTRRGAMIEMRRSS